MKTVEIIIVALLAMVLDSSSYIQINDHSKMPSTKTESYKVWTNRETCKSLLEKVANADGVTKAGWDTETKILSLVNVLQNVILNPNEN